jgi:hypothetical protein
VAGQVEKHQRRSGRQSPEDQMGARVPVVMGLGEPVQEHEPAGSGVCHGVER